MPRAGLAGALERAWVLNLALVVAGFAYLGVTWVTSGFSLDINSVIFIFFLLGLLMHWTPIAFVKAIDGAARVTGPLLIQYPLYGGIMGIMTATGLAGVNVAAWFLAGRRTARHPAVLELRIEHSHLTLRSQRRRPLGRPGAVCSSGCGKARRFAERRRRWPWRSASRSPTPIPAVLVFAQLAIAGIGLQRVMAFTVAIFVVAFVVFGELLALAGGSARLEAALDPKLTSQRAGGRAFRDRAIPGRTGFDYQRPPLPTTRRRSCWRKRSPPSWMRSGGTSRSRKRHCASAGGRVRT